VKLMLQAHSMRQTQSLSQHRRHHLVQHGQHLQAAVAAAAAMPPAAAPLLLLLATHRTMTPNMTVTLRHFQTTSSWTVTLMCLMTHHQSLPAATLMAAHARQGLCHAPPRVALLPARKQEASSTPRAGQWPQRAAVRSLGAQ
jgi:hypothetical protein